MKLDLNDPRYQIRYGWLWLMLTLYILPFAVWFGHLLHMEKPGPWPLGICAPFPYIYLVYATHKELYENPEKRRKLRLRPSESQILSKQKTWPARVRFGAITYCAVTAISLLLGHFFSHPTPGEILFDSLFLPLCWILIPWASSRASLEAIRNILDDTRALDEVVEIPVATAVAIAEDEAQTLHRQ